jgi:hypothetical protein
VQCSPRPFSFLHIRPTLQTPFHRAPFPCAAQPKPTPTGRELSAATLPSFPPRRAPFKRAEVAAVTLVPRATVSSLNRAHATPDAPPPPPYRASVPHCWSAAEATATSASPVSSSIRPSPSSIQQRILLPFLPQCSRANL